MTYVKPWRDSHAAGCKPHIGKRRLPAHVQPSSCPPPRHRLRARDTLQNGLFRAAKRPVSSSKTACPGVPDRPFCKTLNTKLLAQWGHRLCRFTTEPAASGARWPPAGSAAQSLAAHPSTGITMPWRQSAPVYSITSSSPLSAPRALKASESISFSPGITTTGAM